MGTSSHPLLTSILAMLQGRFKQSPFSKTTQIRYLKAFLKPKTLLKRFLGSKIKNFKTH